MTLWRVILYLRERGFFIHGVDLATKGTKRTKKDKKANVQNLSAMRVFACEPGLNFVFF